VIKKLYFRGIFWVAGGGIITSAGIYLGARWFVLHVGNAFAPHTGM
jgi:hypothetical protein